MLVGSELRICIVLGAELFVRIMWKEGNREPERKLVGVRKKCTSKMEEWQLDTRN